MTPDVLAKVLNIPLTPVLTTYPALVLALVEAGIHSPLTEIAAIATVYVETGSFKPIHEYGTPLYFEGHYGFATKVGKVLGNTEPGDGNKYHGRGLIQLTGKNNYAEMGRKFGVDLLSNPDLALDLELSCCIFADFFKTRRVHEAANARDWERVRRLVNGGTNGWPKFKKVVDELIALYPVAS